MDMAMGSPGAIMYPLPSCNSDSDLLKAELGDTGCGVGALSFRM